ncbi:hypothetical protein C8J56DRAFT_1004721 [Mycena floridula]|nr:hypothetical protein C8J56DRAFT_1004721 [Mycena floridula]
MDPVENLRIAYDALQDRVRRSLQTQLGDAVLRFMEAASLHQNSFPAEEFAELQQGVTHMVQAVDDACSISLDPPEHPALTVSIRTSQGRPGHPKVHIAPEFLRISQPGHPMIREIIGHPAITSLNEHELDQLVSSVLEVFPGFGPSGHHVPEHRIRESYLRVHGLIRFKIVIHCFIDGKTRLVTGIRAGNNNRGTTVLNLFHNATETYSIPSRVQASNTRIE